MNDIKIGSRVVGANHPTFIIAELSANHLRNYDLAVETIHKMKEAGADCVKMQTGFKGYITIDSDKPDFVVGGGTLWDGRTLYDLYNETETPLDWFKPLQKMVHELGMEFFSSPFDHKAVEFLADLDVPAYKIASFEITDIGLIRHAASKGKPVIISTGIATEEDIEDAVNACHSQGNKDVILLKCTSAYPTPLEDVNLNMIPTIQNRFQCHLGLSDHTLGHLVPLGAVALGARVIEKHFITDRNIGGPDAAFSMQPEEFKEMVDKVRDLEKALGRPEIVISEKIQKSRVFSRSLYIVEDVKEGDILTADNVRSIRPGYGLPPKYLDEILGKKAAKDTERGTRLSWDLID